jgi:hypothetical protein
VVRGFVFDICGQWIYICYPWLVNFYLGSVVSGFVFDICGQWIYIWYQWLVDFYLESVVSGFVFALKTSEGCKFA